MDYLDFDLLIERTEQGYKVRVLNSPAGQASAQFHPPFSDLELENFLLRVGRTRRGVRRLDSPEMEAAKIFGGRLFDAVFEDDVRGCLHSSLDEADRQGSGLRIRLRTTDAPELTDIPWEYLYNSTLNRFLVLSTATPIVRYIDLPERVRPLRVKPPLRVLAMISSPSNYPPLDVEREWEKLCQALRGLEQRRLVTLEQLEEATLIALQRRLRRGAYHIFHFVGHGGFDEQAQDGVLLLEHESGQGRPVGGQYLGTLMHDERTLRLAILNACEGARTSRTDPFAGAAQSLVQQGVPAVIAMQSEITDKAAITLAHEFYAALVDGYPVDAALAEARKAIFAQENDVEWGKPVLYMRSPDGHIFDIEPVSEEEREESQIAALHEEAQAAMGEEDWATAIKRLQSALHLDPGHAETTDMLNQARQQQKVASLYTQAREHYEAGRWREALSILGQVHELSGDYKDVNALIAAAKTKVATADKAPSEPRRLLGFIPPQWTRRGWIAIPAALALLFLISGGGYWVVRRYIASNWPTNRSPYTSSSPSPYDGATDQSVDLNLSWTGGDPDGNKVTYDVYLEPNDSTPDTLACTGSSSTYCDPGTLGDDTHYYWKVVARDDRGATTTGPAWDFTTGSAPNNPPNTPWSPSPVDTATDQSVDVNLSWTGGDPDGNKVTYDVYLEPNDSTPNVVICNDVSVRFCDPGTLEHDAHYYWKVVARDEHGAITAGAVWDFATGSPPNNPPNTPSHPSPVDDATDRSVDLNLSWTGGDPDSDRVAYDVHLEAHDSTPDTLACTGSSSAYCDPGTLNYDTHYYWKVVARDDRGATTTGPVWDFTTGSAPNNPPNTPWSPSPADTATDQSVDVNLSWTGGDPDGNKVTYDVYLEPNDSTPDVVICNDASVRFCDPGTLDHDAHYYWKVVARDEHGATTAGAVWGFTTLSTSPGMTVPFGSLPNGTPITTDRILEGNEFLPDGIQLSGAPEGSYCSEATSTKILVPPHDVRGIDFAFLTSSLPDNIRGCDTVPVEIAFLEAVREVRLVFAGASVVYTMKVYDSSGDLIGVASQEAISGEGTFEVGFTSDSANIRRITFGRQAAITAIKEVYYNR